MSVNFCLDGVGPKVRFGKGGSFVETTGTGLQVRNPTDTALDTLEVLTPALDTDAATKKYVDDLVALSVTWKEAARVCSTSNVSISAPGAVIDGITLSVGDRVVLMGQTAPLENGIRVFQGAASPMTLPADWATASDQSGSVVSIQEGTCMDNIYIASADPAVVGSDDPLFLLIGTTAAGVTSVADAAAVPAGGSSLIGAGPTGAVTLNVLDDSARISVTLLSNVITLDVKALSIGSAQIAAQAITDTKLAPNTAPLCADFTVTNTDQGTTVTGPTLLANSRVVATEVDTTVAFDDPATTIDVQIDAVSFQGPTASDPAAIDLYQCDGSLATVAAAVVTAVVGGSANTVGSATIRVYYYVTA